MLGKYIENRDWYTAVRGRVGIHASASMSRAEFEDAVDFMRHIGFEFPYTLEQTRGFNGRVLGTVEITDCVRRSESRWFQGEFGFVLREPVSFAEPTLAKGSLGFWNWAGFNPAHGSLTAQEPSRDATTK